MNNNWTLYLFKVCNVADCDKTVGHCVISRVNGKKECTKEMRKMWLAENAEPTSCPTGLKNKYFY